MTTNSQLSTNEPKKKRKTTKTKRTTRTGTESGHHMEGNQRGKVGRMGEKVHGVRSIIVRYKLDRGWLRIV